MLHENLLSIVVRSFFNTIAEVAAYTTKIKGWKYLADQRARVIDFDSRDMAWISYPRLASGEKHADSVLVAN